MLDHTLTTQLQGGCALLVGTVTPDGMPHASRGWGCTVLDADHAASTARLRLIVPAADTTLLANLAAGRQVAITSADVRTLQSHQLKGRVESVDAMGVDDERKAAQYIDDFFADLVEIDGDPREMLEAWRPVGFVACTVIVDTLFDQTPGPQAGRVLPQTGSR